MNELIIRKPDDFHFHPRDGLLLRRIIDFTTCAFNRVMVKGNLPIPIWNAQLMLEWQKKILQASTYPFEPIMSIMMVKDTTPQVVQDAFEAGAKVLALIPAGTSTGSEFGVALMDLPKYYPVFEMLEKLGMIFSCHWELIVDPKTGNEIPEIEREKKAIPFMLELQRAFPGLIMIGEHGSDKEMIQTVEDLPDNAGMTLTAHHGVLTIADVLDKSGNIASANNYCKPIAKTQEDRDAVVKAMTSGNPKFFFGSDSAAHWATDKAKTPPNAGCWTAPIALPLLAEIFEANNALDRLEAFVSENGAVFCGLPLSDKTIKLVKRTWTIPHSYEGINLFKGGGQINWQLG